MIENSQSKPTDNAKHYAALHRTELSEDVQTTHLHRNASYQENWKKTS
ncbi:MAG: hypothetical protein OEY11_04985 [Gammaproteobacteria bacterium]|nr:hypothetical protein [Gammaproteobacteria bacterium]